MPDIIVRGSVERLPLLAGLLCFTSGAASRLTKACEWYGAAVSNAAVTIVQEWGVESLVNAMCFDTTASNNGTHTHTIMYVHVLLLDFSGNIGHVCRPLECCMSEF